MLLFASIADLAILVDHVQQKNRWSYRNFVPSPLRIFS